MLAHTYRLYLKTEFQTNDGLYIKLQKNHNKKLCCAPSPPIHFFSNAPSLMVGRWACAASGIVNFTSFSKTREHRQQWPLRRLLRKAVQHNETRRLDE